VISRNHPYGRLPDATNDQRSIMKQMNSVADEPTFTDAEVLKQAKFNARTALTMGLLTGCQDRSYAFGLAMALSAKGVCVDVVGSDEIDSPKFHSSPNLRFLNFRPGKTTNASFASKLGKLVVYYAKLMGYAASSRPKVLHILWNNKVEWFDRTILMLYYKMSGKRVAFTAHNVNQARRDSKDSWLNRTTLRIQYRLCDHIFVHTQKMKSELCRDFGVAEGAVTILPFPVNIAFPETDLTSSEAKRRLGLEEDERAVLFFGRIVPYKGIEYLLDAFRLLVASNGAKYRLIIAGEPKKGAEEYLHAIEQSVEKNFDKRQVILKMEFIPDREMELYFKAADVLALPYKEIFQSGILYLAYSFGLPVVATDVGSFRDEIAEGNTGFLCQPDDAAELAKAIERYFASELYRNLAVRRAEIRDYVNSTHSWDTVADLTCSAYAKEFRESPS
jgi:glycosyltransferase involved in cell wall biosynthesis